MPEVDIIIPIFRTLPYLEDLFVSIANLDPGDNLLNFVLVHDFSEMQQQEIARVKQLTNLLTNTLSSFDLRRFRFKQVVNHQNLGLAGSRNAGIAMSFAPYILWHDSDDVFTHNSIKDRVAFMESHPEVDFAYGSYWTFRGTFDPAGPFSDPEIKPFDYTAVLEANQFSTCGGVIRRDKFVAFDPVARVAEDYVWVLNHLHEYKWQFIPNLYTFYYRIRPDSLSNDPEAQKMHLPNVMAARRKAVRNLTNLKMIG